MASNLIANSLLILEMIIKKKLRKKCKMQFQNFLILSQFQQNIRNQQCIKVVACQIWSI